LPQACKDKISSNEDLKKCGDRNITQIANMKDFPKLAIALLGQLPRLCSRECENAIQKTETDLSGPECGSVVVDQKENVTLADVADLLVPAVNILCLKDQQNSSFCLIQQAPALLPLVNDTSAANSLIQDKNFTCTNCAQQQVHALKDAYSKIPDVYLKKIKPTVDKIADDQKTCPTPISTPSSKAPGNSARGMMASGVVHGSGCFCAFLVELLLINCFLF